jgi:hypothetical protein
MPEHHARISPSSFKRIRLCPASLNYADQFPNESSSAAERGTAMHSAVEFILDGEDVEAGDVMPNGYVLNDDEVEDITGLTEWVMNMGFEKLWLEERLPIGAALGLNDPDICWGTSDIIGVKENCLYVIDAKFGYMDVEVEDNDQAAMYSVGALHQFPGEYEKVWNVIIQPRSGGVKQQAIPMEMFPSIKDGIKDVIKKANASDAAFSPGEEQCHFCPASGACDAQLKHALAEDFEALTDDLDAVSNERLAEILEIEKTVRSALDNVRSQAIQRIAAGQTIPGWKRVAGQSRARYIDPDEVVAYMEDKGLDLEKYAPRKPPTQTLLKKLLTTDEVETLIYRPDGSPTLARTEDKRPSLDGDFDIIGE